jgi:hypothetical protein
MFFATFFTASLLVAPALALNINTAQLTQCQDVRIDWTPDAASKGPYNLIVVDPKQPCDSELADLGDIDGTSTNWKVNLIGDVQFSLQDFNGVEAWSGSMTVAKSDDVSCLSAADAAKAKPAPAVAPPSTPSPSPKSATGSTAGTSGSSGAGSSGTTDGPVQAAGAAVQGQTFGVGSNGASGLHTSIITVLSAVGAVFALSL